MTMFKPNGIVTLLSDFGIEDGYVAAMKGAILSAAPEARIADAAHGVPAQDVRSGAWALAQYWDRFPAGTVHVAVVDPGVGTDRRALALLADARLILAPDNGLVSWIAERAAAVEARALRADAHAPDGVSATFHGRDVFAWAAGQVVSGRASVADLTEPCADIVRGAWTRPAARGHLVRGEIVHFDRFGNAVTNIPAAEFERGAGRSFRIEVRSYLFARLRRTYADAGRGERLALINSGGMLELAMCCGNARERLALRPGDAVTLTFRDA